MADLSFYGKEIRRWPGPRLTTASIIGHTTPTSVRLWFRVFAEGEYQLVVRKGEGLDTDAVAVRRRAGKSALVDRRTGRAI